MSHKYKHISASGTFDHFHIGHEALLQAAFAHGEKVSIGVSTDSFIKNKQLSAQVEPFEKRKKHIEDFLVKSQLVNRAEIFPLEDIYGIAKQDKTLQAVVVTAETRNNLQIINLYRKEHDLMQLDSIQIPFIKTLNKKIIRSSKIRLGELSRDGAIYKDYFSKNNLHLPASMREQLRNPLGIIIEGSDIDHTTAAKKAMTIIKKILPTAIITVGDIATQSLKEQGLEPDVEVIDLKTKRSDIESSIMHNLHLKKIRNSAGSISTRAVAGFNKQLKVFIGVQKKQKLLIQGEEDLLALPAILLSPLGSVVIYGQYNIGLVIVEVTSEVKSKVEAMIQKFT